VAANDASLLRIWLIAATLAFVIAAVYHDALTHDFINYDDPQYVTRSDITQQGFSREGFEWAFTDVSTGNWHPLTRLSHMADCAIFGVDAGAHHATNILIHIANTVLLLLALNRMTGTFWRSAFVAGLFALHPLHVESVAWISERKDVLSGFFWIAAMYAYTAYAERRTIARYALVALLMALGLMSKPMVVTLPAALLLLDIWPLQRLNAPVGLTRSFSKCVGLLTLEKLPLFALSVATAILTLILQEHALNQADQLSMSLRVQNAFASYGVYLKQTIWPTDLAVFYPHPLDNLRASAWIVGTAIFMVCSIGGCLTIKRTPYVFVGWWWFVGTLLPVIGIVQVGLQGSADRYTYLPHIGLFIAFTWGVGDVLARLNVPVKITGLAATIVLLVFSIASTQQHRYWKDTITVFDRAIDVTEDNKLAHLILGTAHAERGDQAKAESHFYAAIQIEDDSAWTDDMPEGHFALGLLADRQGDWTVAAEQYSKAIELDDQFSEAHNNLAGVYMELGQRGAPDYFDRARTHAERALELKPENAQAAANAAFLALYFKDYNVAVRLHAQALPHFPDHAGMHRNMGLALFETGDVKAAQEYAQKALAIDATFAEAQADIARYSHALSVKPTVR